MQPQALTAGALVWCDVAIRPTTQSFGSFIERLQTRLDWNGARSSSICLPCLLLDATRDSQKRRVSHRFGECAPRQHGNASGDRSTSAHSRRLLDTTALRVLAR